MAEFQTTDGQTVQIDSKDYIRVTSFDNWKTNKWNGFTYVVSCRSRYPLGRFILNIHVAKPRQPRYRVLFKDGNPLNCRESNLFALTGSDFERLKHWRKNTLSKSGYRGVYFSSHNKKWRARIKVTVVKDGQKKIKNIELGLFTSLEEAKNAVETKERELWPHLMPPSSGCTSIPPPKR